VTKESAAWLAIRVIGLLLLGECVYQMYGAVVHFVTYEKLSAVAGRYENLDMGDQAAHQALRARVDLGIAMIQVAVSAGLAFYLLRRGKAVHSLLMAETK
jgi:hypothetical protein